MRQIFRIAKDAGGEAAFGTEDFETGLAKAQVAELAKRMHSHRKPSAMPSLEAQPMRWLAGSLKGYELVKTVPHLCATLHENLLASVTERTWRG